MTPDIKQRIEQTRRDELPERYKKTKAGIMPEEWEEKFIKDISSDIYAGATPETKVPEYWKNGTIPWLASGEIHKRRIYETEKSITEKGYQSSSTKMLPANCVLIALAGQGKTRGTVAVNKIPLCTNQSIAAIIPNNCYYQYLYYFLDIRYNNLREISSGDGTRGGLNLNLIANYPVTFPPLPEQQKIADILTAQDKVIELKEQLLAQKQQQKKYLMQQLLTGRKRLPGFNGEWDDKILKHILSPGNKIPVDDTSKYKKITVKLNFKGLDYLKSNREMADTRPFYIRKENEIIIGKQNYFNGSIALIDKQFDGCICSNAIMSFSVHDANPYFVLKFLSQNDFLKKYQMLANGTGQKELSERDFLEFHILIPSLKEQTAITDVLSAADREIDLLRQNIEAEKQKKKALMQLLLTGIVRVNV